MYLLLSIAVVNGVLLVINLASIRRLSRRDRLIADHSAHGALKAVTQGTTVFTGAVMVAIVAMALAGA